MHLSGAWSRAGRVRKTSRRDLAYVMARRLHGATTVSATMLLAARAGIHIFVTGGAASEATSNCSSGCPARASVRAHWAETWVLMCGAWTAGIGGVHRGSESTMDVSADLTELGRTPVAVVCAGAKSILDIPRTLEYLETQVRCTHPLACAYAFRGCLTNDVFCQPVTRLYRRLIWELAVVQGVSVAAYGADEFPAFFTRRSGCRAPMRIDTPEEGAALIQAALQLNLDSGIVIGAHLLSS